MNANDAVLNKMQDKLSRYIYMKRIDYSNGKNGAIEKIITLISEGKNLVEFMENHKDRLYIFGAGVWGRELQKTWGWKYKFCAYIDNNEKLVGKVIEGVPVISLNEVRQSLECDYAGIIISTRLYWNEVFEQLTQGDIKIDNLFNMGKIQDDLAEKQYFDLEYLDKKTKETFVDIGAFDGKTSIEFYKWYAGNVGKIYLFEPDKKNVKKCRENLNNIKSDYEIINKGVWSETQICKFRPDGNGASCITQDGGELVEAIRLDDFFENKEVTFIKMDIEGAELKALEGAENLIKNRHPKLAVCVYHKNEDIDQIPRLLLKYYPGYRFYLRHYSVTKAETVLYAI